MQRAAGISIVVLIAVAAAYFAVLGAPRPKPVTGHGGILRDVALVPSGDSTLAIIIFADGYCLAVPFAELQSRSWAVGQPSVVVTQDGTWWPNNRRLFWVMPAKQNAYARESKP